MTDGLAVDWVDAFTDRAFGGNGCAVVHEAAALDDATCMAFTRETSLTECTFVGPSAVADMRVRYFLASREIPFAGHPTIATVASLVDRGALPEGAATLETQAGLVPVWTEKRNGVWHVKMTQIAPSFGEMIPRALLARVLEISPEEIINAPQFASTGLPFCITILRDRDTVDRARLNLDALSEMAEASGAPGLDMMEPYLVTLSGATAQGDTYGRLLMAPPSPPEDPFTGSATGAAAAYMFENGYMTRPSWRHEQGHGMGRPGQADVTVLGAPGAITGVEVSGAAHILMRGTLHL